MGCQLKSDQAIKSLCLKGHVRARGLTLWRHRWQEASEFLCTKTTLLGESWATKHIAKNPRKCTLRRATNVTFSKFRGWRRKKQNCEFFETALRAVVMNSLIRINSGPNILRSYFLHWSLPTLTTFLIFMRCALTCPFVCASACVSLFLSPPPSWSSIHTHNHTHTHTHACTQQQNEARRKEADAAAALAHTTHNTHTHKLLCAGR